MASFSHSFQLRQRVTMNNMNRAAEFILSDTYTNDGFECLRCGCSAHDLYSATPNELMEWFQTRRNFIWALDRQVSESFILLQLLYCIFPT